MAELQIPLTWVEALASLPLVWIARFWMGGGTSLWQCCQWDGWTHSPRCFRHLCLHDDENISLAHSQSIMVKLVHLVPLFGCAVSMTLLPRKTTVRIRVEYSPGAALLVDLYCHCSRWP